MADDTITSEHNPDVLSCLANLSNDEVFTPPAIVNQMLDMLPQKLFRNPDTTFLDPACKTGVFLREIAKRLIHGLEKKIPDLQERVDHIFQKQLFGIAITEMTGLLSRRGVYCSKYPNKKYSVTRFRNAEGNIRFRNVNHSWENGRCKYCGISQETILGGDERGSTLEAHAYEWIHTLNPEEIFKMKFDVIISNPPYQLSDGGQKASATPIYQMFIRQAKKLMPRYLSMVVPARWYSGGRGLESFREEMLNDKRLRILYDFTDSNDCFPGVDIAGGICYFLWNRDSEGDCEVVNVHNNKTTSTMRSLNKYDVFIRDSEAISVIEKVQHLEKEFYSSRASSQKPFGLRTYVKPYSNGDITLRYNGGKGPFLRSDVTSNTDWIDKWKVIMSYLTYDHAGRADKDGRRKIFSTMEVLPPKNVCTETYLVIDCFETEDEANNLYNYLRTSFVRFLVAQRTSTQHISKNSFSFVPVQDFSKPWTDEELYAKYDLTEEEIAFIDSMIRPMDLDGGDDDVD
ncbi:restriction endonuclease [Candidatus Sumerlaeota bacterium]|nr:restriction endonuclease [Candidatus Sumerlaeota bacterium]